MGIPVSFTNKTDRHDITEILLKLALSTTNQTNQPKPSNLIKTVHFILLADRRNG
jgi:hypothetical protein